MTVVVRHRQTRFAVPSVCSLLRNNPLTTPLLVSVVVMQAFVITYVIFERGTYTGRRDCAQQRPRQDRCVYSPTQGSPRDFSSLCPIRGKTREDYKKHTRQESSLTQYPNELFNPFDTETCTCGLHYRVDAQAAQVFPASVNDTKYLTIGIPTILRQNKSYIVGTVTSLLDNMSVADRKDVVIVILAADLQPSSRRSVISTLEEGLGDLLHSGAIHVIAPPENLYANLKITKKTYGQSQDYVEWRSKQNFDYAYLMRYCAGLSQYYMQLEDDVNATRDYVTHIRNYVKEQTDNWTCLEFSELGFIGKLYHTYDLEKLSRMLLLFYQEQPVDYTYMYFNAIMLQLQKRLHMPTLFQHQGLHSSFPGKQQTLKDKHFSVPSENPLADVYTSMFPHQGFLPELPYTSAQGYFWSTGAPVVGDFYLIVFREPQALDRVTIETGTKGRFPDRLEHGVLKASLKVVRSENRVECMQEVDLGAFNGGRVEVTEVTDKVKARVACLRIIVTGGQKNWLMITKVTVLIAKTS